MKEIGIKMYILISHLKRIYEIWRAGYNDN